MFLTVEFNVEKYILESRLLLMVLKLMRCNLKLLNKSAPAVLQCTEYRRNEKCHSSQLHWVINHAVQKVLAMQLYFIYSVTDSGSSFFSLFVLSASLKSKQLFQI